MQKYKENRYILELFMFDLKILWYHDIIYVCAVLCDRMLNLDQTVTSDISKIWKMKDSRWRNREKQASHICWTTISALDVIRQYSAIFGWFRNHVCVSYSC